jgi:hypothetical protein
MPYRDASATYIGTAKGLIAVRSLRVGDAQVRCWNASMLATSQARAQSGRVCAKAPAECGVNRSAIPNGAPISTLRSKTVIHHGSRRVGHALRSPEVRISARQDGTEAGKRKKFHKIAARLGGLDRAPLGLVLRDNDNDNDNDNDDDDDKYLWGKALDAK